MEERKEADEELQMKHFAQAGAATGVVFCVYQVCLTLFCLTLFSFCYAVAQCVRASSQSICRSLFQLFAENAQATAMTEQELGQMLFACLLMAEGEQVEDVDRVAHVASALARAVLLAVGSTHATCDDFVRWIGAQFPLFYTIFMSWMARKSFDSLTKSSYEMPRLSHKSAILAR